ncbi:MAG: hypothetical protein KDC05_15610 [Bacteroidales bacterium]|nr:hypothetical protein [Bacteroidales bacterium]
MNSRSGSFWKFSNNYFYSLDHYYATLEDKYGDPRFFNSLFNSRRFRYVKTTVELAFKSKIQFGSGIKTVADALGKPQLVFQKEDVPDYEIWLYRTFLAGEKVKIELHFHNKKLCIYNYIFSYLSQSKKQDLLDILSLKYLDDRTMDIASYKVTDKKKNFLIVEDSVDLSIWYVCGNSAFLKIFTAFQNKLETEKQSQLNKKKQEYLQFL